MRYFVNCTLKLLLKGHTNYFECVYYVSCRADNIRPLKRQGKKEVVSFVKAPVFHRYPLTNKNHTDT